MDDVIDKEKLKPPAIRPAPPPLPTSAVDHLAHRKLKSGQRTLNDHIEDHHLRLIETEKYRSLLDAVYDEQAVEGSQDADDIMAAELIRDRAVKMGDALVSREKLATIAKALAVVLRRYGFSRKERRLMVAGEVVEAD